MKKKPNKLGSKSFNSFKVIKFRGKLVSRVVTWYRWAITSLVHTVILHQSNAALKREAQVEPRGANLSLLRIQVS